MNIDPNKLTDEQLQYFLIGIVEASPCTSNSEKKSLIRYYNTMPRKQLVLDALVASRNGWQMDDWLDLDSIRNSLKKMNSPITSQVESREK